MSKQLDYNRLFENYFVCSENISIKESIAQLDNFINKIDTDLSISNESIIQSIKQTIFGFYNFFINIFNSIKLTLFNKYSTLRETELQYWLRKNSNKLNAIKSAQFDVIKDVVIPTTTGMNANYQFTLSKISDALDSYNIENNLDMINSILTKLQNNDPVNLKNSKVSYNTKNIDKIHLEIQKLFSSNKKEIKTVNDMFSDIDDLTQKSISTFTKLANDYLLHVKIYADKLNTIIEQTDFIIKNLNEGNSLILDKEHVENLSYIIRFLAVSMEYFSVELLRVSSLEHNYCLTLDQIYTSLN